MDNANMTDVVWKCIQTHLHPISLLRNSSSNLIYTMKVHEIICSQKLTQCPGRQHLQVGFVALDGVHVHEVDHEFG